MKIEQVFNGTTYYLNVESHYHKISDTNGQNDAVMFEMCQYEGDNENNYEVDALITCSVKEARAFAESILNLCDDIENSN